MKYVITKEKWAEIVKDFHEKEMPEIIPRKQEIGFEGNIKRAISIIGPRRSGKTYEMFFIIKKIRQKYGNDKVLYVNFERADLEGASFLDLVSMLETYYEIYPKNKASKIWLFLDEIQNVNKWEKFVRSCLDEGISVFLSGSSSKLLSRDIATSMRGRNLSYNIYPFSFVEFLSAKNFELKEYYSSSEKSQIIKLFEEFMAFGGYPEAIIYASEREKIIKDIYDTAIYRDVIERGKIRNIKLMKLLMRALLTSNEFSINKFFNFIKSQGIKTSKNSLYKYAELLNDAFFVFFLRKHDLSYKKSEQSLPKVYFVDNGFLTSNGIDDRGKLLENVVFLELIRRNKDIAYYQNSLKEEVDFVVKKGKKVEQLVQVSYSLGNFMTSERELKILIRAGNEFNCSNLLMLTMHDEKEEIVNGKRIKFIPVWKWLIS